MKKKILLTTLIGFLCLTFCGAKSKELTLDNIPYDWPKESPFALEIPLPDAERTRLNDVYSDDMNIDVFGSYDDYRKYIEQCIAAGYDIDITDNEEDLFGAYREDGAFLRIYYEDDSDEEKKAPYYSIVFQESWIKDDLEWPERGLALNIPKPVGTKGKILANNDFRFSAFIGEMPEEKALDYIEECKKLGFTKDSISWDRDYSSSNESNPDYYISIQYGGVDSLSVLIENHSDD